MKTIYDKQVRRFIHWVSERETIRLKRAAGQPAPWTKDKILSTYRFCNVRRRDDRVSQWVINRVIQPYNDHPNLWIQLALTRYINWPDTLNALMEVNLWPVQKQPRWADIGAFLDQRVAEGEQTYTGAYMIRAESNHDAEWYEWGKGKYLAEKVLLGLWENRKNVMPDIRVDCETAWEAIGAHYGFGSFMAGQVVADYTYSNLLNKARDLYTWAPLGPGSLRGLNRLLQVENIRQAITQDDAVEYMLVMRRIIIERLGESFADLTLHDVQNCLCEFDKHQRVRKGEGRPRSIYRSQS